MNPDSKLYLALRRQVRNAKARSPKVEVVYYFSELPVFDFPNDGIVIEGVRIRPYYPSAVVPPDRA